MLYDTSSINKLSKNDVRFNNFFFNGAKLVNPNPHFSSKMQVHDQAVFGNYKFANL